MPLPVSILSRAEQETDPLPVVSKHVGAGERGGQGGVATGVGWDEMRAPGSGTGYTGIFQFTFVFVFLTLIHQKGAERLPGT